MSYDPGLPVGHNKSLIYGISAQGLPELNKAYSVPARCGVAVVLKRGQLITIENPCGHQVCDFWAFIESDPREYMSMGHTRTAIKTILPSAGDTLVTNLRRPILTIKRCDEPVVHDTLMACCDSARYEQLGCTEYHDNCADNFRLALIAIGREAVLVPSPFNLWMNVPVYEGGRVEFEAPVSKPGSEIDFSAEEDCVIVMSACPQDMTPVNGDSKETHSLFFSVK